ncbi:[NiFe]-hydrogenase assembly chaperone HybE [Thioalkalivibrio sp. ALJT]|uniref:[NiFe]-hydrogenase assembly chaperone HybE n=1 Tax=Thioalkalivibrio sp. ALJT TaxID=1158146 RepID=UPI00037EBB2C|nr:[NiFe]-hydrogenase assembly chaperone HybE [Thioalkalivibrio sp. ALJT]
MDARAVEIRDQLEVLFEHIQRERMHGMALCNAALQVEALGFGETPGQGGRLGVLITPWSMNLIHLPVGEALTEGMVGRRELPAGEVDFVGAYEEAFGAYEACSLFSPVLEFPDALTARAVANEALGLILGETSSAEGTSGHAAARSPGGRASGPVDVDSVIDRRRFLRGAWRRHGE